MDESRLGAGEVRLDLRASLEAYLDLDGSEDEYVRRRKLDEVWANVATAESEHTEIDQMAVAMREAANALDDWI